MMHDMSYMQLIELCGSREEVTKLAEALGDPSESAGIGAKVYTAGTRQGTTILYGYPSGFPTEPLGPALFLWDCFKSGEGQGAARERQLWIWVHPGSLSRVLESLEAARKVVGGNVTVKHLAGDVVRFRLMGPRSTLVLKSLLDVVDEGSKMELWKQITKLGVKADGLLEGSVVGLAVQDPRLSFPQKIRKGDNNGTDSDPPSKILTKLRGSWPLAASASDFWSAERRKQSKDARASEKKLNQRREANMVPGTRLKPLDSDPAIPILLVQRRGLSISGTPDKDVGGSEGSFGSGWDLLVPSGWGMSFWKSLAFLECRPIALKEVESLHFESNGLPFFPNDFVGNPICIDMAKARAEEAKALWERTPTGKRTNFADLGTDHPFLPPWEALVGIGDETMEVDGIATPWTLHSEKLLHHLERALVGKTPPESSEALLSSLLQSFNEACRSSSHFTREMLGSALVTVRLKCVGRGLPEANAMIYKPTAEEHAKCLEFVSRASPARKIAVDEDGDEGEDDLDALVAAIQAEAESDENHLPAPPNDRIIGYASTAGYALVHGRGQAIGACSLSGLAELFVGAEGRKWRNLVLFRNPSGRVARPAFLEIAFN